MSEVCFSVHETEYKSKIKGIYKTLSAKREQPYHRITMKLNVFHNMLAKSGKIEIIEVFKVIHYVCDDMDCLELFFNLYESDLHDESTKSKQTLFARSFSSTNRSAWKFLYNRLKIKPSIAILSETFWKRNDLCFDVFSELVEQFDSKDLYEFMQNGRFLPLVANQNLKITNKLLSKLDKKSRNDVVSKNILYVAISENMFEIADILLKHTDKQFDLSKCCITNINTFESTDYLLELYRQDRVIIGDKSIRDWIDVTSLENNRNIFDQLVTIFPFEASESKTTKAYYQSTVEEIKQVNKKLLKML